MTHDIGLENAIDNLKDAAKALLAFERAERFKLCAWRRLELISLASLTLAKLQEEEQT